jgi:hypothetical protein
MTTISIISDIAFRLFLSATALAAAACACLAFCLDITEAESLQAAESTQEITICTSDKLAREITLLSESSEAQADELELRDCETISIDKSDLLLAEIAIDEAENAELTARIIRDTTLR